MIFYDLSMSSGSTAYQVVPCCPYPERMPSPTRKGCLWCDAESSSETLVDFDVPPERDVTGAEDEQTLLPQVWSTDHPAMLGAIARKY